MMESCDLIHHVVGGTVLECMHLVGSGLQPSCEPIDEAIQRTWVGEASSKAPRVLEECNLIQIFVGDEGHNDGRPFAGKSF